MNLDVAVKKQFGTFELNAVFQTVNDRCGVFGPSGSGKSTLMNLLAGLMQPDTGRIVLNGTTLFDSAEGIRLPPDKRRVGVVFQHSHLFPHMTVRKNLFYGWQRIKTDDRKISPEAVIDILNLTHLMDRNVTRLSGGERQRVALGRTLLACPRLILLDEPLTGLDRDLKFQIIPYLIRVLSEFQVPLIFISHSLQEMRMMTDEVLVFGDGTVQNRLSAEDLARQCATSGGRGYANHLRLTNPVKTNGLWSYRWGQSSLVLTESGDTGGTLFELGAKDIILFKRHPEATSARNLLPCRVTGLNNDEPFVSVELDSRGQSLIAQIVPESVKELCIGPGSEVVAAIKASAFKKLY